MKIKPISPTLWENCPEPGCNNTGGYPRHAYGCDGSCVNCPEEEQCKFCWTNPNSVFNQQRLVNAGNMEKKIVCDICGEEWEENFFCAICSAKMEEVETLAPNPEWDYCSPEDEFYEDVEEIPVGDVCLNCCTCHLQKTDNR